MVDPAPAMQHRQRGSALVWALLFVIITSGMIVSHSLFLASNRRDIDVRYRQQAMATTSARSGLRDALGWFRKQPQQPVDAFAPGLDPEADPPLLDTLDPTLGLVREFEIRGGLWGRYEVRKDEAQDVSQERGMSAPGSVWAVGARGYVYSKVDPAKRFDEKPNRIVSATALHTELRGITLIAPAASPVVIDDPASLHLGPNAKIDGGTGPAIAHGDAGGGLLGLGFITDALATVIGIPSQVRVPVYRANPEQVFGMGLDTLRGLSDYVLRRGVAPIQGRVPDDRVVFVDGDLVLPGAPVKPLQGRMLLIVNGNLVALAGNQSVLEGMVFVTGNADIQGPFSLNGTLAVRGSADIGCTAGVGEVVTIRYDAGAIQELKAEIARYRVSSDLHTANQATGN